MITSVGLKHLGFTNADFELSQINGETLITVWNSDQPQPTVAEIEAADAEWHLQNDHKIARASAYPSIADQLDQIYHEGIDAWKETIAAVKAEYPKP
jgi:hypothetical protein